MVKILSDDDLTGKALMPAAIDAVERAFLARASSTLVSPPRHHVSFGDLGDLVFTIGGTVGPQSIAGFRVYDTFKGRSGHSQIVAVWSPDDTGLKGIILGERLGSLRTGAIGGVAIRYLSRANACKVGILGSGIQACTQLEAAAVVRNLNQVRVHSRSPDNRNAFAREMEGRVGIAIDPVDSVEKAVEDADIIICATTSNSPILAARHLPPGVHVNTLGPKTLGRHEIALDIADVASSIATDSIEQTRAYTSPFFLVGTQHEGRLVDLARIVGKQAAGRASDGDMTLFCSVGLAGTEVVVASAVLDMV